MNEKVRKRKRSCLGVVQARRQSQVRGHHNPIVDPNCHLDQVVPGPFLISPQYKLQSPCGVT